MSSPHRIAIEAFRALPLQVHSILADVPLHDVTAVDLPGGGVGRTVGDLRALAPRDPGRGGGKLTRALFGLRATMGRVFGWDDASRAVSERSYRARIPAELARRSLVPPGTRQGFFETMYELENESLVEARNATVHAFLCQVLLPTDDGYRFYWAVYVRRVSWFTPFYMASIEPFRRFIVYPSLLRALGRAWESRYPDVPHAEGT